MNTVKIPIFLKTTFMFLLIVLFCLSMTGVIFYNFATSFVVEEKIGEMINYISFIENAFNSYLSSYLFDNRAVDHLLANMRNISYSTSSVIWIAKDDYSIIFSTPSFPDEISEKYTDPQTGFMQVNPPKDSSGIVTENEYAMYTGNFNKFFSDEYFISKYMTTEWVTIEKKVNIAIVNLSGQQENSVAYIFFNIPMPQIQSTRSAILQLFAVSSVIAFIFVTIMSYYFSRTISRPLKAIAKVSREVAKGNFNNKLIIRTHDEVQELAENFNNMIKNLNDLEKMRSDFISNVSHELRTPMTSIGGFIEGIMDGTVPDEKRDYYLGIVRDEIIRLSKMVNELLDLARMESGEHKLSIVKFNINELVRNCIITMESLFTDKNLDVEVLFEDEDSFVNADKESIRRVIINLLHNAIKFTGESGKITISVNTKKDRTIISVEDTGAGISPEDLARIWDRFYKSDKSRSMDRTGTGLGLSIVKNIITEHGEDVFVESELGKGTKFWFTLKDT